MAERQQGDLRGRIALVTGSSAGLGLAAARALAARGARVAVNGRGAKRLEAARREVAAIGGEVIAVAADLGERKGIAALVAEVQERLGPIDVLVANSGGPRARPAVELGEADWEEAIPQVLLFVPRLCRLVLPGMRQRRWGRIVAINSVSARQPIPGLSLSNTLRPAVLGYLKTLASEVAADGVTVNAVLPGYTRTERQVELAEALAQRTGRTLAEALAAPAADIPLGRMAEPEEIAQMIAVLCSPASSYVTGQAVAVDGGWVRGL